MCVCPSLPSSPLCSLFYWFIFIDSFFLTADYKEVVERDPKVASAVEGAKRMEQASKEKQEREKEELMGKLKDLGNMMLKPFGLCFFSFHSVFFLSVNTFPFLSSFARLLDR